MKGYICIFFFNKRSKGLTMQLNFHSLLWPYSPRVPIVLAMTVNNLTHTYMSCCKTPGNNKSHGCFLYSLCLKSAHLRPVNVIIWLQHSNAKALKHFLCFFTIPAYFIIFLSKFNDGWRPRSKRCRGDADGFMQMSRLALCCGCSLLESMSPGRETGTRNAVVSSSKALLKISRHTKCVSLFIYMVMCRTVEFSWGLTRKREGDIKTVIFMLPLYVSLMITINSMLVQASFYKLICHG